MSSASAASSSPEAPDARGSEGYRAARVGLAALDRSGRTRLLLRGRAPEQILVGLVSGRIPAPLSRTASGAWLGRAEDSALLTAKGKMVAVLRLLRGGPHPDDGFLLDVPAACRDAALAHLRKFVPPRLAAMSDVSESTGMLTVLGPSATEWLSRAPRGVADRAHLDSLDEGDLLHVEGLEGGLTILRTGEVAVKAFDVLGPVTSLRSLWTELLSDVGQPLSAGDWDTLRVEAGRPAYGTELDESTIPVEAGIQHRVVDYEKGCFTGQEVLIRIRDRGHVNRLLRGLRMGKITPPEPGTPLFREGEEKPSGAITSAVQSPLFGEAIGLGYLRRDVEPPARVRLGSSTGAPVGVFDLESDWSPTTP